MIEATYHRQFNRLTIEGHAYSGDPGHDLVCASASILAFTLADRVGAMAAAQQVKEPIRELAPGKAEISCKPNTRYKATVTLIFDSICAGFELLAHNYPENIHYEILG